MNPNIDPSYGHKESQPLVIKGNRPKTQGNEPTGEASSLAGRTLGKFGSLVTHEKPPRAKDPKPKEPARSEPLLAHRADANVLGIEIGEEQVYRPRTRETRILYARLLTMIERHIGDTTQEVMRGAADQLLAILKMEGRDAEKKKEVEAVVMDQVSAEEFNQLVTMARQFVDFSVEERGKQQMDQAIDMAVIIEEKEEEKVSDQEVIPDDDEEKVNAEDAGIVKTKDGEQPTDENMHEDFNELNRMASGLWLQEELSHYYSESDLLEVERFVMDTLGTVSYTHLTLPTICSV
eukprot:TRINITY_DN2778_c0_g7_i1.p1 TRINITY_DN2778_c0_g7~~TRINITY_DN2778_c0_g7_i1.p1  ORF type:complete len:292 (-),score=94.01 TRINITY_DN2778_c0_g7_i1:45-920(-)